MTTPRRRIGGAGLPWPRPAGIVGLAAVLLALAGCGVYDSMRESIFGEQRPPPCPRVLVLPDGATVTKFRAGPGRDLIDVLYQGRVVDILSSCEHDVDDDIGEGTLTVELEVVIGAERGPADRDRSAAFSYFVAVADTSRAVLNKKSFSASVPFPGNLSRVTLTDRPVILGIPLKVGQNGSNFEIVVGFQMSRQELEFNRRRRANAR